MFSIPTDEDTHADEKVSNSFSFHAGNPPQFSFDRRIGSTNGIAMPVHEPEGDPQMNDCHESRDKINTRSE